MRVNTIDIIKGIAIIMIVNVHLIRGPFFSMGCTFHVIAFFFASGLIHGITEKWNTISVWTFAKQKAKRLLYPFLTLSLCYMILHVVINILRGDAIINEVIKDSVIKTVTLRGIGTLWFLPVLFCAEIIFFVVKKYKMPSLVIIIIGLAMIFLSSYLNYQGVCGLQWYGDNSLYGIVVNNPLTLVLSSIIATMYISIGYLTYKNFYHLLVPTKWRTVDIFYTIILCLASLFIDIIFLNHYSGDLHKLNIGQPIYYLICSISGLLFVSSLSLIIECCFRRLSSLLQFFGKNSLIIMTTHAEYYINSIAFLVLSSIFNMFGFTIGDKILSGLSLCMIMLIEIVVVCIINNSFLKYIYLIPKRNNH